MDFMRQDNGACAVHIERRSNVCFGSKADIGAGSGNFRFAPESGHFAGQEGVRDTADHSNLIAVFLLGLGPGSPLGAASR
jgi:hypothetical protein